MQVTKNAILYCRVSSTDQLDGTSLEVQERSCREYAERQGFHILEVFIERGESAKTAARTELNRALAFCSKKAQRVEVFIVHKLDRFSRNTEDHVLLRASLRRMGTELVSATEPIDTTPMGRFMETILSGVAELDNNVRTERTKAGMLERVRQGVWVWPAPLGYYRPEKGTNITPHPTEAPFIRLAFQRYAEGTYTYKALAGFLNDQGFRSRGGGKLYFQQVEKILRNPLYAGVIDAWGQRVQGSFQPIVDPRLWQRCQPGWEEHRPHASPRSANNPLFPLRRVLVCTECGEYLTGSSSTGRSGVRHPYYHHRKTGCPRSLYHRKQDLEDRFLEHVATLAPGSPFERVFRAAVLDVWAEEEGMIAERREEARRAIERLTNERRRIFAYHRSGVYGDEDFAEQRNLVDFEIREKGRLAEETAEGYEIEEVLEHAFSFIRNPARSWEQLEPTYAARIRLQRLIFRGDVPFDGERCGTADLGLIYALNQEFRRGNSPLVALIRMRWNDVLEELHQWAGLVRDVRDLPDRFDDLLPSDWSDLHVQRCQD
jgi:DNA invertase Pin-like site-specific DNA recombinase